MQTTIAGYEVVSKLGHGGMGTVYEVRDGAGQKLALKVLRHLEDVSALAAERFRREFALLSRLRHPNLVAVMQSDITDGTPFYTMELVTGQTINQVPVFSRRPGPELWGLQNATGFRLLLQLLDAIEYMHQHGIVHRDLKPSNIMLNVEGVIKVMDFGLARDTTSQSSLTETGTIVGTIEYSSPEQLADRDIDTRSDLYSLGVLLYEICTGTLPFPGDLVTAISRIIFEEPKPAGEINEHLPAPLSEAIMKLLAKGPEQRFQTVDELRRVLLRLAETMHVEVDAETAPGAPDEQPVLVPGERLLFVPRLMMHEAVQDAMDQFLRTIAQGHNRFALVEAEEGMGKTRLAEEMARRADRRGIKVLHVNCEPNEVFPYHAIQPLIVQARRKLEGVELEKVLGHGADLITSVSSPSGQSSERAVDKFRLFDVFARMLKAISDRKPCLLIVDDLHQADADSFELLSYLVRDLVFHPEEKDTPAWGVAWLSDIQRDPHVTERIRQVTASHDITRFALAPFSPEELTRFVASILGDHERAQMLAPLLHGETGGNPGFTYETLKGMVDSGNLVPERGGWKLLGGVQDGQLADVLPQSLREAYANRLARLPQGAKELLVVSAMLGSEFNYQELRHCAGREEAELLGDLDTLLTHRLLREVRGRRKGQLAFSLPQIRKHLISEMSFAGQQQLHLQILRALETAWEQGDRRVLHALAWHARRAGVVDKSLKYLLLAAQASARSLAHDRASDLFEQAAGLPGFAEQLTPDLRDLMYEVLMSANRFTRAADLARQSAQLEAEPAPRAHWLHRLGRAMTGQSKNDEALHYYNASLETLGFKTFHGGALVGSVALEFLRHLPSLRRPDAVSSRTPSASLVEALEVMLDLPNLFYFVQMPQRDIFFFNNMLRAFNVAHHMHVPELQTMVNATYAFMLAMVPHPPMKLIREFVERAVAQVPGMQDTRVAIEVCRFSGYCDYVIGDFDKGVAASQLGLELAEKWNNARGIAHCSVFLALNRWMAGPCAELSLAASTAVSKCEATGDSTFLAVAQKTMCAALAHEGNFAPGLEMVARSLTAWADDSGLVEPLSLRYGEAFLLSMQREDETALARFCRLQELWLQAGLDKIHLHLYGLFAGSSLMRLVQAGRRPATPASFDRIQRWIHDATSLGGAVHFVHGWARVLEAQLLASRDQFPRAASTFARGVAEVEKAHAALLACECRLNFAETLYAAALTATHHRAEMLALAGEQRQAALDQATRLGSHSLVELARKLA